MTQRGRILIIALDDGTATQEITVYAELADQYKQYFKEDEFLAVQGKVSEDRFNGGLRVTAEKVMDIAQARIQFAQALRIEMKQGFDLKQFQSALDGHINPDGCPLVVQYQGATAAAELRLADQWRVNPDDVLQQKLVDMFSQKQVAVVYE